MKEWNPKCDDIVSAFHEWIEILSKIKMMMKQMYHIPTVGKDAAMAQIICLLVLDESLQSMAQCSQWKNGHAEILVVDLKENTCLESTDKTVYIQKANDISSFQRISVKHR